MLCVATYPCGILYSALKKITKFEQEPLRKYFFFSYKTKYLAKRRENR